MTMFAHEDSLAGLDEGMSLQEKVTVVHRALKRRYPSVGRVAIAAFDPRSRVLRAYVDSTDGPPLLSRYEAPLDEVPSLMETALRTQPRVVNDLSVFAPRGHTAAVVDHGFRASYTLPVVSCGAFMGFVFIDSWDAGVFTPDVVAVVDVYAHLVSGLVVTELFVVQAFLSALRSARRDLKAQNPQVGAHLDRLSSYARLMARRLYALGRFRLSGLDVERIATFGPVYAVGDHDLPGQLFLAAGSTEEREYREARTSTARTLVRIQSLLADFFEESALSLEVVQRCARFHLGAGEAGAAEANALERRVVGLADIFDAFASPPWFAGSRRPEDGLQVIQRVAQTEIDRECVRALTQSWDEVRDIHRKGVPAYGGFGIE